VSINKLELEKEDFATKRDFSHHHSTTAESGPAWSIWMR